MHPKILGLLVFGTIQTWSAVSGAQSFVEGLGFEIGGVTGAIDPNQYNNVFDRMDVDGMDHLSGITIGVTEDLNPNIRLALRSGYLRASSGTGEIALLIDFFPPIYTEHRFIAETVPLSIGADFRLVNKAAALVLGLAGELHFLSLTEQIDEQPAAQYAGYEESSNATFLAFNGGIGIEWQASRVVLIGLRGGYRFGETDIDYPGATDFSAKMDITGGYGAVSLIIQPWGRADRPSG